MWTLTNIVELDALELDGEEEGASYLADLSKAPDFIDEAPVELPKEFSMNTYQDLAHHFKIICQLFVHVAALPQSERHHFMKDKLKS